MRIVLLLLGHPERDLARSLGDTEVRGVDDGQRRECDEVDERVPLAGGPLQAAHRGVGDEHVFQLDIGRAGAAHAHRAPRVEDLETLDGQRQHEVADGRSILRVVVNSHGREGARRRDAARKDLAPAYPEAAVDFLEFAGPL